MQIMTAAILAFISLTLTGSLSIAEVSSIKLKVQLKSVNDESVTVAIDSRRVVLPRRLFDEKQLRGGMGKTVDLSLKGRDISLLFLEMPARMPASKSDLIRSQDAPRLIQPGRSSRANLAVANEQAELKPISSEPETVDHDDPNLMRAPSGVDFSGNPENDRSPASTRKNK